MEYFYKDVPTAIPERPQLKSIKFTCGGNMGGLHIWYRFEQPEGQRITRRIIGYYKMSMGVSTMKYAEEKVSDEITWQELYNVMLNSLQ